MTFIAVFIITVSSYRLRLFINEKKSKVSAKISVKAQSTIDRNALVDRKRGQKVIKDASWLLRNQFCLQALDFKGHPSLKTHLDTTTDQFLLRL